MDGRTVGYHSTVCRPTRFGEGSDTKKPRFYSRRTKMGGFEWWTCAETAVHPILLACIKEMSGLAEKKL